MYAQRGGQAWILFYYVTGVLPDTIGVLAPLLGMFGISLAALLPKLKAQIMQAQKLQHGMSQPITS